MLSNAVFNLFQEERYKFLCLFLEDPTREITLDKDHFCRQGYADILDKKYKCNHCHQLVKICRQLPEFTVESGEKERCKFRLIETCCLPLFNTKENLIFYDVFRGSYLISLLLENLSLPTLNYITCSYTCRRNNSLVEVFSSLDKFTLEHAKQLLITLKILEGYKFVLGENVEFSTSEEKVNLSYQELTSKCNSLLKINLWKGSSMSFNSFRIISGERKAKSIKINRGEEEEWFHAYSNWRDRRHVLKDTRFNVYLCFISLYPYLDEDTKLLWNELWKEEFVQGDNLDCYSLRNNCLDHLISCCS